MNILDNIMKIIVPRDKIAEKVKELGQRISRDYADKELVVIGVLKGGFIFLADLAREVTIPVIIDFMAVSSYCHSKNTSGVVKIIKDTDISIEGRHVLIVEDIIDSGLTLNNLKELLHTRGPLSVKICTMLDKPSRRKVYVEVNYKGFEIPDEFVVGYGLDYSDKYRNLPDVVVLSPDK